MAVSMFDSPPAAAAKMDPAAPVYRSAFNTAGRVKSVCASERHQPEVAARLRRLGLGLGLGLGACELEGFPLADLADGPYYAIAAHLGAADLRSLDAACRLTRDLDRVSNGPWCNLGRQAFLGMELDGIGSFEPEDAVAAPFLSRRRPHCVDWKVRYARFLEGITRFRSPFSGSGISGVDQADETAYCRCTLQTGILGGAGSSRGVFLEIEVGNNPDNVSLTLIDFEAGGCSSVTFSPDTGAVIRERKVQESPRKVEGTYIQPLPLITSGQGYQGSVGLYLKGGNIAFYRRQAGTVPEAGDAEADAAAAESAPGAWECTGFVTDLSWAEAERLTPCVAFRNPGDYQVRIAHVGEHPPVAPQVCAWAFKESSWQSLDWDALEQEALEE